MRRGRERITSSVEFRWHERIRHLLKVRMGVIDKRGTHLGSIGHIVTRDTNALCTVCVVTLIMRGSPRVINWTICI